MGSGSARRDRGRACAQTSRDALRAEGALQRSFRRLWPFGIGIVTLHLPWDPIDRSCCLPEIASASSAGDLRAFLLAALTFARNPMERRFIEQRIGACKAGTTSFA